MTRHVRSTATRLSAFLQGVWLDNVCDQSFDGFQAIIANYSFTVPSAVGYNGIEVESYGHSISTPEPLAAIIYNSSTGTWDPVGAASVTQYGTDAWSTYGTVTASGHVSGSHVVTMGIGVPDTNLGEDYDFGLVAITVSFEVLQ